MKGALDDHKLQYEELTSKRKYVPPTAWASMVARWIKRLRDSRLLNSDSELLDKTNPPLGKYIEAMEKDDENRKRS